VPKILYPFSLVYSVLVKADRVFASGKKLDRPVISVGNITWGGTGKTPVVIELLEALFKNNLKPAVLTRGYARKEGAKPLLLKKGGQLYTAAEAGDEPLLIFKSVPQAEVIIGAKRYDNALRFKKDISADIYVLDDGFQHWKIKRDLDIVCVNAANPFGNRLLIPAGILREKPSALKRAGIVVITNADMITPSELEKLKKEIYELSGKNAFVTHYGNYEFCKTDLQTKFDEKLLKNSQVYSLSGIGFSGGFQNTIKKAGIKTSGSFVLKDHNNYAVKEIENIFNKIGSGAFLITTSKDAVKLDETLPDEFKKRIAVLKIKPVFENGKEQWEKEIINSLRFS